MIKQPYFSLILCTLNRNDFVFNFLNTVSLSTFKNFEIILVDQNKTDELQKIIKNYKNLNIKYLKSDKGLSIGRNKALKEISGEIVCFPDDDCEYPENILKEIHNIFSKQNLDLLSVQSRWKDDKISNGNFDTKSGEINKYNVWGKVISYTIFIKSEKVADFYFDENIGVGSKTIFQSGEESDFVIRLISEKNIDTYYFSNLFIYHPHLSKKFIDKKKRVINYAPGKSYVLQKNNYSFFYKLAFLCKPLFQSILYFILFNKKYQLKYLGFLKRLEGFRKYSK